MCVNKCGLDGCSSGCIKEYVLRHPTYLHELGVLFLDTSLLLFLLALNLGGLGDSVRVSDIGGGAITIGIWWGSMFVLLVLVYCVLSAIFRIIYGDSYLP